MGLPLGLMSWRRRKAEALDCVRTELNEKGELVQTGEARSSRLAAIS